MSNIYALVVGLDQYPAPVRCLDGCVNDAKGFSNLLQQQYKVPAEQIRTLLDADATRDAIIGGFREHLSKAKEEDLAVFFFAGHGSQVPTGGLFVEIEPDGKNESLVCYDSRTPDGYDLVDKDVATLIQDLTASGPRLTVVFDCCHSGSGTRDLDDDAEVEIRGVRKWEERRDPQPESVYLRDPRKYSSTRNLEAAATNVGGGNLTGFAPDVSGQHVLFAACSDFQVANEYYDGPEPHGAFSYFLLKLLAEGKPLGNEELHARTSRLVRTHYPTQTPHLECLGGEQLRRSLFLGDTPSPKGNFSIAWFKDNFWKIDAGGLDNLRSKDAVALYPASSAEADLGDREKALTTATLTAVGPSESTLVVADASRLDPEQQYKAVVTSRASRIQIAFEGDAAAVGNLRSALAASAYVAEGASPRFLVHATTEAYSIEIPSSKRWVPGPFPANTEGAARTANALEHMAKWTQRVELANPASKLPTDAVDMAVIYSGEKNKYKGEFVPPMETLNLTYKNGQPPTFRLRVTNRGIQPLYFALLACSEAWGIETKLFAGECERLEPTQEIFALQGTDIPMRLNPPATEAHDYLVLIISTDDFDASAFALDKLTKPAVSTRDFGELEVKEPEPSGDFTVRRFEIVTKLQ